MLFATQKFSGLIAYLLYPLTTPRQWVLASVLAMVGVGVGLWGFGVPDLGWIEGRSDDVPSYVDFASIRTALYPAFLDVLGDNMGRVVSVQLGVHLMAVGGMVYCLARVGLPLSVLVVFVLVLAGNFFSHSYHYIASTESLSLSLVYLIIGFMAMYFAGYFAEKRILWLGLAMLCAMLMFGMRPNALAFPLAIGIVAVLDMMYYSKVRLAAIAKTALAVIIPVVLVAGVESAYYFAQHDQRSGELLDRHLFAKASLVIALNKDASTNPNLYHGGFEVVQPFMHDFGTAFRSDADRFYVAGNYCGWIKQHTLYEDSLQWGKGKSNVFETAVASTTIDTKTFALGVFANYPWVFAKLIGKYYINFFCVLPDESVSDESVPDESAPISRSAYIDPSPHALSNSINRQFAFLLRWGFIGLGVCFFVSKIWYVICWGRLVAKINSPPPPPPRICSGYN